MTISARKRHLAVLAAPAVVAGCGGGSGNPIAPAGIPSTQNIVPLAPAETKTVVDLDQKGPYPAGRCLPKSRRLLNALVAIRASCETYKNLGL